MPLEFTNDNLMAGNGYAEMIPIFESYHDFKEIEASNRVIKAPWL